jgi:hypothetical protein
MVFQPKMVRILKNMRLIGFFVTPLFVLGIFLVKSASFSSFLEMILIIIQIIFYLWLLLWSYLDVRSTRVLAKINTYVMDTPFVQVLLAGYLRLEHCVLSSFLFSIIAVLLSMVVLHHALVGVGWDVLMIRIVIFWLLLCFRIRIRFLSGESINKPNVNDTERVFSWDEIISCVNTNIKRELVDLGLDEDLFIRNNLVFLGLSAVEFKLGKKKQQSKLTNGGIMGANRNRRMHRAGGTAAKEMGESVFNWYKNNPDEAAKAVVGVAIVVGSGVTYAASQYVSVMGQAAVDESTVKLNDALAEKAAADAAVAKSQEKLNESLASEADARKANLEAQTRLTTLQSKKLEEGTEVSSRDSHKNVSIKSVDSLKPSGVRSRWFG